MSEELFDREKFAGVLGSTFTAQTEGIGTCELSLAEVSELKDGPSSKSFSVVFLAPKDLPVGQGLYELEHESLDPMALFLVPVGSVAGQTQLEAVFNFVNKSPAG
jgi:hypothetical protein